MRPAYAFIGAKQALDRCAQGFPRPVLLGLDGDEATYRRGDVRMKWRFSPSSALERVIDACRTRHLGCGDVLVVPSMTRLGAAACEAYGVGWCDSEGRCDIIVDAPYHHERYLVWHPSDAEASSIFDDPGVAAVATYVAAQPRGWVDVSSAIFFFRGLQSQSKTLEALEALVSTNLLRRRHAGVRFASRRVSRVLLELLTMSDDDGGLVPPDAATSRRMRAVRSRDTHPELAVRRALHSRGIRYRTHVTDLPGTPDLANKSAKWAVFVHGCFWHAHDCENFRVPTRNEDFWREKFAATKSRDERNVLALRDMGYDVHEVWECEVEDSIDDLVHTLKQRR